MCLPPRIEHVACASAIIYLKLWGYFIGTVDVQIKTCALFQAFLLLIHRLSMILCCTVHGGSFSVTPTNNLLKLLLFRPFLNGNKDFLLGQKSSHKNYMGNQWGDLSQILHIINYNYLIHYILFISPILIPISILKNHPQKEGLNSKRHVKGNQYGFHTSLISPDFRGGKGYLNRGEE